jgi:hypothetical protein
MDLRELLQAMEANRAMHERAVAVIRRQELSLAARRDRLAGAWCDAMRTHYRLLNHYLDLRERQLAAMNRSSPAIDPQPLRAPARPEELPESISRYVFVGVDASLVIGGDPLAEDYPG